MVNGDAGAPMVDLFEVKAVAAGAEVKRAATLADAWREAVAFARDAGLRTVAASADALALAPAESRGRVVRPEDARGFAAADAGLVLADHGVAETGTLVHMDRPGAGPVDDRHAWTFPPVCIALLRRSSIVARIEDLAEGISKHLASPAAGGAQVSCVTGPSRTADIECATAIGVHGPGRLVVVIAEGD